MCSVSYRLKYNITNEGEKNAIEKKNLMAQWWENLTSSSLTPVILRIAMIGSCSEPRIRLFASESICPGGGGGTVTRDDSSRSEAESCSPRHVSGGREGRKVRLEMK